MDNFERIDGTTPNNGAYAIVYFFDANGKPASKDNAVQFVIQEFDTDGRMICETVTH